MRSQLAGRFRDWTTFEPWSGASINTVVGGADLQELPLPVLLGLAAMLAVAASGRARPLAAAVGSARDCRSRLP